MRILLPLGFLGLIGIAVLILIYLLKPNYQQKVISSTYIWKLSLRYRKKRIPVSKLRSLLILLCQILVVTACAFILARPVTPSGDQSIASENVAIIDASAGMRAETDGVTRFERAVEKTRALAEETFRVSGGVMSVIIASDEPYYLVQRADASSAKDLYQSLDALLPSAENDSACTYASADVEGALSLAQSVVDENSLAEVYLYTGTAYLNPGDVKVVSVREEGEWNAAVLNAQAVSLDNKYSFEIEVAVYGKDEQLTVSCDVYGPNGNTGKPIEMSAVVSCTGEETQKVSFVPEDEGAYALFSYDYVHVYISADDSYTGDNVYYLYGGTRDKMRIQYASSSSSLFWLATLESLQNTMSARWNFADPKEVRLDGTTSETMDDVALTGYDFYIFEGKMPEKLPDYGLIFMVNPDSAPVGANFTMGSAAEGRFTLTAGNKHAITNGVDAGNIHLKKYTRITSYDAYEPLLYCNEDPVWMIKEDFREKEGVYRTIVVMSFSINDADFAITSFPKLFLNMFNYGLPTTVTDGEDNVSNTFEVGEKLTIKARGIECTISNAQFGYERTLENFEGRFTRPGTYIVKQTVMFEDPQEKEERIFVKISAKESNICREEDSLAGALIRQTPPDNSKDWLLYLAIALTAFLFVEWLLQAKENF